MRAGRRHLGRATATLIVAFAAVTPSPASADFRGGEGEGDTDAYIDNEGNPTAEADETARRPSRSGGSAGGNCEWLVVIDDDTRLPVHDVDGTRLYSDTGRWFGQFCGGIQVMVGDTFAVPEGEGPPVDPEGVARRARESVTIALPQIATSPSADRRLYTQVPTWLWLEGDYWRDYSATANAGAVSATVTAAPVRTVWETGDGANVTCEGPGVPWREGMEEDDTYCSHTYRHSSAGRPGGTYTLAVTVHFEVSWTSNVGDGGTLAGVSRTSSRPVRVGEIQAVESG